MDTWLRWRRFTFCLLAFGWLVSAYLLLRMISIGTAYLRFSKAPLCWGCDEVLASAASFLRGLPLPGLGLIYFAIIGFLLAIGGIWATRLAFLLCSAGMGASILMSGQLFTYGGAFCILCLLVHAANLVLLTALFAMVLTQAPRENGESLPLTSARACAAIAVITMATSSLLQGTIWRP